MDWVQAGQMMTAIGAGAAAVLTIQKVMRNMKSQPLDKPVQNGERRIILAELKELKDMVVEQNSTIGHIERNVARLDRRLLPIERAFARSEQGPPTQGSRDY